MNIYYWNVKKNFGDLLGPLLLGRFSGIKSIYTPIKQADIVVVGSILHHIPNDWKGIVAGCGKLHEHNVINIPDAKIVGLRGPLTAKGVKGSFALGDPGLLADELVKYQDKVYDLGIVAHWSDQELNSNPLFLKYNHKIINVGDDPLEVIKQIGQCRKIVSSSLHGIIIADAFGIPRRIEIPKQVIENQKFEGGIFKWKDYNASVGVKFEVGLTQTANENIIIERQHELFDMFEGLRCKN